MNFIHHSLFTTRNNGFDLSLSFSLIAQSKAPLENYVANIELDIEFRMLNFEFISVSAIKITLLLKFEVTNSKFEIKKP
jgi:hypothetical protein